MYPDSKLHETWEYFVPDPNETTRNPKPVKDITFLDPACGSGHFLLVAFDLFYQMYVAEGIVPEEEIPHYILTYNLHGIDIDRRAIQLSALNLYLKAKQYQPDFSVKTRNTPMYLFVADAVMMDGNKLDEFLAEVGGDKKLGELVKTIWSGMQNVRELGSLLKVDEQIDALIEGELSSTDDKQLAITSVVDSTRQNWEKRKAQLMRGFRNYYEKASQVFDVNRQLFANEAVKGVQLLDLLERRYDVVATNPPYMSNRNMGTQLKRDVNRLYPKTSSDLYAAFIDRCLQLTQRNGYTAMITQQSFMFITTYEALREIILTSCQIRTMAHLGPHAFEDIGGEKVNTTMFSCMKQDSDNKNSTFIRLADAADEKDKETTLLRSIHDSSYAQQRHVYTVNQGDFRLIDGWPFAYWVSKRVLKLFKTGLRLGQHVENANCSKTGNNDKFLRYWWEVASSIGPNQKWVTYSKGGERNKWYGNLDLVVDWSPKARQFYRTDRVARITEEKFWYKSGMTFSSVGAIGFSARFLPEGCVFDMQGPCISNSNDRYFLYARFV